MKIFYQCFFINVFLVLTLVMIKFVKTSTINLMTRGFDDLTLSFMKQNYDYEKLKKLDAKKRQACKSLDTEHKFLKPILMLGQNNTRY